MNKLKDVYYMPTSHTSALISSLDVYTTKLFVRKKNLIFIYLRTKNIKSQILNSLIILFLIIVEFFYKQQKKLKKIKEKYIKTSHKAGVTRTSRRGATLPRFPRI